LPNSGLAAIIILLCPALAFCQAGAEDLDSVSVFGFRMASPGVAVLPAKRIDDRLAGDAGQLMTLFPGMQLRSYGGLGGLKTMSFRSLGANHTSVVIDRFALSQTQSGQTDLGQLPVDFVRQISVVYNAGTSVNYPVHSKLAGIIVDVQTRHLPFYSDTLQLAAGTQIGSFGQRDAHLFLGFERSKWRFAASGKIRAFEGDYPFSYMNALAKVSTKRKNGYLEDRYGTASVTFRPNEKNMLHLNGSVAGFRKGLPGAVVFYNETAGQHLSGTNALLSLRHELAGKKLQWATAASYQQGFLQYTDSTYLNLQGYLQSDFISRQAEAQSQIGFDLSESQQLLVGLESRLEELQSQDLVKTPRRNTNDLLIAWSLRKGRHSVGTQLGATILREDRPVEGKPVYLQPMADYTLKISQAVAVSAGGRYTVRQPTFGELYYNQIGSQSLTAERAGLAWLRFGFGKLYGAHSVQMAVQPFYVYAYDKILAVPTKNLFIWSIQNLGRSDAAGTEATLGYAYRMRRSEITLNVNYTFQHTRVFDDQRRIIGQIAYSPLHSGTATLGYERKKTGFSLLATYQGARYVLTQDIAANRIEDFVLLDISAYYRMFLGQRQSKLTLRAAVNNLTNDYYSYIRYFVMPGINYAIRLTYDF
jgi:vitamin B12 transporter